MTNPFGNLKDDNLEAAQDTLGGYAPLPSGIYSGTIKAIYAGKSDGGAHNVTVLLDLGGRELRETIYISNKKGENWYPNKQSPDKKLPLPGFTIANDLALVATGLPLSEQPFEDKILNVYDPEQRKEVPKSVSVMVDAIGKPVSVAVLNVLENKAVKDQSGNYIDTAETRNSNTIDKVFDTDSKMTVAEAREQKTGGIFWAKWSEMNSGKVRDKRTIKDGAAGSASSGKPVMRPTSSGAGAEAPRKSLFGQPK